MYPSGIGYPIGGPGAGQFVVIEMHYDNPQLSRGTYVGDLSLSLSSLFSFVFSLLPSPFCHFLISFYPATPNPPHPLHLPSSFFSFDFLPPLPLISTFLISSSSIFSSSSYFFFKCRVYTTKCAGSLAHIMVYIY